MNWFKENPFLAGLAAVTLFAAGALGFLLSQSAATYTASFEAYTDAVSKLHTLQNKVPFPSEENLGAIQKSIDTYSSRIHALQAQLAKMEVPLDENVTPQQFQDGLRTAVNDLRKAADTNGVKIPESFYFGFDEYQSQVPSAEAAPALYREFRLIQSIVSRLVDFKVASVDSIVRPALPVEMPAQAATQKNGDKAKSPAANPGFQRIPFDLSFTAEQAKVRVAFNSLLSSEQFLIVRSLSLQNTSTQAPPKISSEPSTAAPTNPFAALAGNADSEKKSLQVILGRELVKITLHLEMLDFSEPPAAK